MLQFVVHIYMEPFLLFLLRVNVLKHIYFKLVFSFISITDIAVK